MRDLRDTPYAGRYVVGLADPAWKFQVRSERGLGRKDPSRHYRLSATERMGRLPVSEVMAPDAWLFVWATFPMLAAGEVHKLVGLWSDPANPWVGVTGGAWAKRPRNWRGDPDKWQFGTGYLFRSAVEPLLVFRRGKPPGWATKSERNLWVDPIREHSRKPDSVRAMIDRSLPDGPRLEMFSREAPPPWDAWGDQEGLFDG